MIRFLKSLFPDTHPLRLTYHRARSWLSALRAGFPARRLTVIAVTGTDGKTTTVAMISHILHQAGIRIGSVSTAYFEIDGKREPNPTQKTSVAPRLLQSFLRRLVDARCTHVVIEASSHGLLQGRLLGITPTVSVITNTSKEHLDYHGSMDAYVAAKARIFQALGGHGTKVLNADDLTFQHYNTIPSEQTIAYSPAKQLKNIRANATESRATLTLNGQPYELTLGIPGAHNLANALCAMSAAMAIGIDPKNAAQALQSFRGAGGRMERIEAGQPFTVFVDFTVTPAAYLHTLSSARTIAGQHRLLVLTGSCGDRMPEKRPEVGALCARFADIVAVTNEDPYTENPEKIIDEVLAGIPQTFPRFIGQEARIQAATLPARYCIRISDRLETIRFLFREAKPGDVVLLCGKGTDVTMMTARGQIPWNEREIAFRELQTLGNASS